ncbi:hypothetical protein POX_h09555 [Penicillium oxalicum]|uniref:hypothetical protein n=1 Tax=Penicillium oxalicum TaxID=69781 RepID=UPI0020B76FEB|nr:hypothetical protein POX_h09555 [Penicillium oxalicum]KAI2785795.1 hypothetical protein POX_h09555 [Penicillium oxalicum]
MCRIVRLGFDMVKMVTSERSDGFRLISDSVPDSPTARRTTSTEPVLGAASAAQTERFVGDLNPEAVIRERLHESSATPLRDRIGLWIHSADRVDAASRSFSSHEKTISNSHYHGQHHHRRRPSEAPDEAFSSAHSIAERRLFQQYESAMQACNRLPWSTVEPLTTLYFAKINPIIPLLDPSTRPAQALDTTVTPAAAANPQRRFSPLLERAICLVAAKDPAVKPHLHLTNPSNTNTTGSRSRSRNPLPSRSFCTEIYHGLVSAMHAGLEPDRYTRIRILALLSLHCEGYEGAEAASLHLCEAIHQAQTVGLHLARPGTSRDPHDALSLLFWGLWTLDKMHACLGGRPIILADRDIGLERPWGHERSKMGNVMDVGMENGMNEGQTGPTRPRTLSSKSNPDHGHLEPFRVWFRISEVLATVIRFYRPSAEVSKPYSLFAAIPPVELTSFLSFFSPPPCVWPRLPHPVVVVKYIILLPQDSILTLRSLFFERNSGLLELYYHSVAILSRRYSPREPLDHTKHSSLRQGLSALRIHSLLLTSESAHDDVHQDTQRDGPLFLPLTRTVSLPALPIIPYALSLALGVSYREMRSSRLITHLDRAKASLAASCALLESLSAEWYAAEAMARLGRKALMQIEMGGDGDQDEDRGSGSLSIGSETLSRPVDGDNLVGERHDDCRFKSPSVGTDSHGTYKTGYPPNVRDALVPAPASASVATITTTAAAAAATRTATWTSTVFLR